MIVILDAALAEDAPPILRSLPALELLRKVWVQNYVATEDGLRWKPAD